MPDGVVVFQDDVTLLSKLGKRKEDVYPYRYRYYTYDATGRDHHIDEQTGWSR